MPDIEVLKLLPPGASVTAVIIVVMMFIKHLKETQAEHRSTVQDLTDRYMKQSMEERNQYNEELKETRSYFSTQIREIGDRFTQAVDRIQSELRTLSDKNK